MRPLRRILRIVLAASALAAAAPSWAQAAPDFGCGATAARIQVTDNPPLTLYAANGGGGSCNADTQALAGAGLPTPDVDAAVLRADTTLAGAGGPRQARQAGGSAQVEDFQLDGASLGVPLVRAGAVSASAGARCVNGAPVLEGASIRRAAPSSS